MDRKFNPTTRHGRGQMAPGEPQSRLAILAAGSAADGAWARRTFNLRKARPDARSARRRKIAARTSTHEALRDLIVHAGYDA